MKNVFIKSNGEIEVGRNKGRLASVNDLNESICQGNREIEGLIQVDDGLYMWHDNTNDKDSVEDIGEVMEYIKHDNIVTLYTTFKEDIDEMREEIMSVAMCEDEMLKVVTRGTQNNTLTIYNYFRMNGEIIKNDVNFNSSMLEGILVA
jgi:hypothetical protein